MSLGAALTRRGSAVKLAEMLMLDSATGSVPVTGSRISGVAFYSYQVELSIESDDGKHLLLAIGGPFRLLAPDGVCADLNPEGEWTALAGVLSLKFAALDELTIDALSNVRLATSTGWTIEVSGGGGYENWKLSGFDRMWVGGAGGGEPTYWPPSTPT
jgi:hypothetical protein